MKAYLKLGKHIATIEISYTLVWPLEKFAGSSV
jgi:hypothetical protein